MSGALPLAVGLLSFFLLSESTNWKDTKAQPVTSKDPQLTSNLVKGSLIFGSMLIGLWGMFSWISSWVTSLVPPAEIKGQGGIAMMFLGAGESLVAYIGMDL
ncbi:MAG: hypothetical protein WDO15_29875 [Bacteroidota bacterium]